MKRKVILGLFIVFVSLFTGCFTKSKDDILTNLKEKIEKSDSYHVVGDLEIMNNEDSYKYDIDVSFKKDDMFRVSLINKTNSHQQIILKNQEGVYVLTPSLNKSFKFQSEWPYNNSQSYLLQNLINDIENDKDVKIEQKDDMYIITTTVTYSNNKNLVNQKIYVDQNGNIKTVEVLNEEGIVKIKMNFETIDLGATFEDSYFSLNTNMNTVTIEETLKEIEDIIYPMYMPSNTYLESEDTIDLEEGERIILTFAGDSPFMIVEETVSVSENNDIIPVYGDPELLVDTFGNLTSNSASWISNGIEYYAVSEVLESDELLKVIQSISVLPVGK
ncbi:MAG: LolA family protein [Bacilli bacterium]